MITAAELKGYTVKDLVAMARKQKVVGWHDMRKDELVQALVKNARKAARNGNGHANGNGNGHANGNGHSAPGNGHDPLAATLAKKTNPMVQQQLRQAKSKLAEAKDLSFRAVEQDQGQLKDRLVVMVLDPYWLHAYWEISPRTIERASVAMGQHWHAARPILRVHEVSRNGTTNAARLAVRDVEIHGGVNNWYLDVPDPPKSYQLEIGYLADADRFYSIARSNVVSTPAAASPNAFDKNWAEVAKDFDRIYAMSGGYVDHESHDELKEVLEQQLHRPVGEPLGMAFASGGPGRREFKFHVDTELIVHGVAHPDARVTLRGEPIRLRPDGSFAVRFSLPDRRHVLPVVARSSDGAEQRTIVLAVDRNTKVMEPVVRDGGE
jgi:uncharacterized protein